MDGLNKSIYEIGSDSAFSIMARSNQLIKEGKDVINLGIGQPDFPTPQKNILFLHQHQCHGGIIV